MSGDRPEAGVADLLAAALSHRAPSRLPPDRGDRRAAVALLLRPSAAEFSVLFVKRAEAPGDPWSGHMALPGGHMEAGDADLLDTARRETLEEVGLALPRASFLGRLDDIRPMSRGLPSVVVSPFVGWSPVEHRVRAGHEVDFHLWIPYSSLRDPRLRSEVRLSRGGEERVFPSILFEGNAIWGLTHRVISNFLEVVDRAGRKR